MFTQIGTSVLPLAPGKTKPAWTDSAEGTMEYNSETYYRFSSTRGPVHDNYSAVNDDMEYEFTITLYSPQKCVLYIELRDDKGQHAVLSGGLNNPDYKVSPDSNGVVRQTARNYLVSNFKVSNGIATYKSIVKLKPGTKLLGSIRFMEHTLMDQLAMSTSRKWTWFLTRSARKPLMTCRINRLRTTNLESMILSM